MSAYLATELMGKPLWMWGVFLGLTTALLVFDLGVLHRKEKEIGVRESLMMSAFYIIIGLLFGLWIWSEMGRERALEYVTGFVVEKSLAMDNVFVIAMIFGYFAVPQKYQHRVLFWGILGVILLRGLMIGVGAALLENFGWILYVFAAFLILTGIKMLLVAGKETDIGDNPVLKWLQNNMRVTKELHGKKFWVRQRDEKTGKMALFATPLFLCLVLVEIADVIFAVDSVPAIFAITKDPYIVYTSNIFAILGLRALYFALASMIERFAYLKYALATILIFIGSKILVADMLGIAKVPASISLGITFTILFTGVAYSLWKTRKTV